MHRVDQIVYRYLSDADFFNINKPPGSEVRGGGQSYIDFSTASVPVAAWRKFLAPVAGAKCVTKRAGPHWSLPVSNVGLPPEPQTIEVYQRRPASVSVARQKLGTRQSNRVRAWRPDAGFPKPIDRESRHQCPAGLVVFLARAGTVVWAGWWLNDGRSPPAFADATAREALAPMLEVAPDHENRDGIFSPIGLSLDEDDARMPFQTASPTTKAVKKPAAPPPPERDDESDAALGALLSEDVDPDAKPKYSLAKVRKRNTSAVAALKKLYEHTCQITGTEFLFRKKDGTYYTEVHHLIPLGRGGADDPRNMLVVSPQLHKMLHHADVGEIDLKNMAKGAEGLCALKVTINEKPYTIRWRPKHAELIQSFAE